MTCQACSTDVKDWNGSDRQCAFPNGGWFTKENWNCKTLGQLRELLHERDELWAFSNRINDDSTAYVDLYAIGIPDGEGEGHLESGDAHVLWMAWYKGRGCVDSARLLDQNGSRAPVEADLVAIISRLEAIDSPAVQA